MIGNTPLVELKSLMRDQELSCRMLGKLESYHPAGSIKDRVAWAMIEAAEKEGVLQPGATVIEATSGNTGVGLAAVCAIKGYPCIIVMPEGASEERHKLIRAYGGRVEESAAELGMNGALKRAEELHGQIVGSYIPGQFENPVNVDVHRKTTGPEIWRDTEGRVDILVAGVGTGGTITGVGEYLRTKNPKLQIVAVEPERSPFLTEQRAGAHGIYGIGAGFWPKLLNRFLYNEVITVEDDEAREWAEWMARQEGLLVGISSGAAIAAAVRVAHRIDAEGKTMVVILPDGGERYFSTGLFQ